MRRHLRRAGVILAMMALPAGLAGPSPAQFNNPLRPARSGNPPCVLDKCLNGGAGSRRHSDGRDDSAGSPRADGPGQFDFYLLSLSWSPAFCDTGGDEKAPDQCAAGRRLGFVVHGLWPQNERGFPSDCDPGSRAPSRVALDSAAGLYPDEGLARHEWRQHGTCSGLSPADYFAAVRRARDAVTVPPAFASPEEPQNFSPNDIIRAFAGSNPGLRADTMAVTCRAGELQEVRICFTKDLRGFLSCPEVSRRACRAPDITVLPVR